MWRSYTKSYTMASKNGEHSMKNGLPPLELACATQGRPTYEIVCYELC